MKKILALLLACIMIFSLAACGSNTTEETGTEVSNKSTALTETKWIDLYNGTVMVLNKDGSLELGENKGTWTQKGDTITLNYTFASSGGNAELYADILDENGVTIIRTQKSGKVDGGQTNFSIGTYYPEECVEAVKAEIAKSVGDSVATDILEVTVKKAALGYYAVGASTSTSTGNTTNVNEACEPAESGFFESSKGRCLLCIDFVIKNTDRANVNTGDYIISFTVNQNGKSGIVRGYDLNNKDGQYGLNLYHMPISTDGGDFKTNDTGNAIIDAGQSMEIKYVGVVGFEPDDLTAPFEVVVDIINSNGESEQFIYAIK